MLSPCTTRAASPGARTPPARQPEGHGRSCGGTELQLGRLCREGSREGGSTSRPTGKQSEERGGPCGAAPRHRAASAASRGGPVPPEYSPGQCNPLWLVLAGQQGAYLTLLGAFPGISHQEKKMSRPGVSITHEPSLYFPTRALGPEVPTAPPGRAPGTSPWHCSHCSPPKAELLPGIPVNTQRRSLKQLL